MPDLFFYRDPEDEEEERALAAETQMIGFFAPGPGNEDCSGQGELAAGGSKIFTLRS